MNSFPSKEAVARRGGGAAAAGAATAPSAAADFLGESSVAFPRHRGAGRRVSLDDLAAETFFSTPIAGVSPAPAAAAAARGAAFFSGTDEALVRAARATHRTSKSSMPAAAAAQSRAGASFSGTASSSNVGPASASAPAPSGAAALPSGAAAHARASGGPGEGEACCSASTHAAGNASSVKKARSFRPGYLLHKVQPADTLLSIALQYDVPVPHLMLANKLSSSDIWFIDTVIIPGKFPRGNAVSRAPPPSCTFPVAALSPPPPYAVPAPPRPFATAAPAVTTAATSSPTFAALQQQQRLQTLSAAASAGSAQASTNRRPIAAASPSPPSAGAAAPTAAAAGPCTASAAASTFASSSASAAVAASHVGGSGVPADTAATAAAAAQGQDRSSRRPTGPQAAAEDAAHGASAIPESVHQSAHLAMLVDALVRQEGVDAKLARAQVIHWHGDYYAAALDCKEIRHWQQTLGVSVQEILAYLSVHNYDVDKARTAMVEDVRWHQAHADRQQQLSRGAPSRSWFSFSFLTQFFPPMPSTARYARLADHPAAAEAEEEESSCSSRRLPRHPESPRIIGLPSSCSRSSAAVKSSSFSPAERLPSRPIRSAMSTSSSASPSFFPSSSSPASSSSRVSSSSSLVTALTLSADCGRAATTAASARHAGGKEGEAPHEELRRRRSQQSRTDRNKPERPRPLDLEMSRL